tara:strand:- start:667 stop:984 length:318 start_codon:yes stop_codon:yes gene_type:complete
MNSTNDKSVNKPSREELLMKLRGKVSNKQAGRMNKAFKEKKVAEITEKMTNGNEEMKKQINKAMKQVKNKNKKKSNAGKTMEERIKDIEKDFMPKMNIENKEVIE